MNAPEVPKNISKEMMDSLKPLPRCIHGFINSLCLICNNSIPSAGMKE